MPSIIDGRNHATDTERQMAMQKNEKPNQEAAKSSENEELCVGYFKIWISSLTCSLATFTSKSISIEIWANNYYDLIDRAKEKLQSW